LYSNYEKLDQDLLQAFEKWVCANYKNCSNTNLLNYLRKFIDASHDFQNRNFFEKILISLLSEVVQDPSGSKTQTKAQLSKIIHIVYGTLASGDYSTHSYFSKNFKSKFSEIIDFQYLNLDLTEQLYILDIYLHLESSPSDVSDLYYNPL
jgi:cytoplasmic iron level regulating protein YaaA (DUF328/UPF0246 family)